MDTDEHRSEGNGTLKARLAARSDAPRFGKAAGLKLSCGAPIANRRHGRVPLCATGEYAPRSGRRNAFTVVELMVVVVCVALLAAVLLPVMSNVRRKSGSVCCNCNLMQIGLAFRIWSGDNNGRFPMSFYTNASGGPLFADATDGFHYFQTMSNELSTPAVLLCPNDSGRSRAANFVAGFSNTNLSYFIGLDADESQPATFLAGDRNLTNGTPVKNGVLTLTTNSPAGWTKEMHRGNGNVALSDGSVQPLGNSRLEDALAASGTNVTRLLMP